MLPIYRNHVLLHNPGNMSTIRIQKSC